MVVTSLDIGRALAEKRKTGFRAKGTCMYPCIRPDDKISIVARKASQMKVGDIAIVKRKNHLVGHRVIKKGTARGSAFLVTRADSTTHGDDGPT